MYSGFVAEAERHAAGKRLLPALMLDSRSVPRYRPGSAMACTLLTLIGGLRLFDLVTASGNCRPLVGCVRTIP